MSGGCFRFPFPVNSHTYSKRCQHQPVLGTFLERRPGPRLFPPPAAGVVAHRILDSDSTQRLRPQSGKWRVPGRDQGQLLRRDGLSKVVRPMRVLPLFRSFPGVAGGITAILRGLCGAAD